jgi:hypothetical protein
MDLFVEDQARHVGMRLTNVIPNRTDLQCIEAVVGPSRPFRLEPRMVALGATADKRQTSR